MAHHDQYRMNCSGPDVVLIIGMIHQYLLACTQFHKLDSVGYGANFSFELRLCVSPHTFKSKLGISLTFLFAAGSMIIGIPNPLIFIVAAEGSIYFNKKSYFMPRPLETMPNGTQLDNSRRLEESFHCDSCFHCSAKAIEILGFLANQRRSETERRIVPVWT